jgi:hypothetical protein
MEALGVVLQQRSAKGKGYSGTNNCMSRAITLTLTKIHTIYIHDRGTTKDMIQIYDIKR